MQYKKMIIRFLILDILIHFYSQLIFENIKKNSSPSFYTRPKNWGCVINQD